MGQSCSARHKTHFDYIREAEHAAQKATPDDLESAVGLYTLAVDEQPSYVMSYYGRGKALLELRLWKAAIADFDMAIELSPTLWAAYFMKAEALENLGEEEVAAGVLAKIPRDIRDLRSIDTELEAEVDEKKVAERAVHEAKYADMEKKVAKAMRLDQNYKDMRSGKRALFVHSAVAMRRAERASEYKHKMFKRVYEAEVGPATRGDYYKL